MPFEVHKIRSTLVNIVQFNIIGDRKAEPFKIDCSEFGGMLALGKLRQENCYEFQVGLD